MSQSFPHLFEPIRIGSKQSRNRIMRLATSTNTGENGVVTDKAIATYRRVARVGVGVMITEGMRVHSTTAESRARGFLLFRKEFIPSLARMAQAIHDEGSLLIAQGNHGGRQHQGGNIPAIMWEPSAIACPHSGGVPHEMSKAEIADVGAGYVTAALNAQKAGCDALRFTSRRVTSCRSLSRHSATSAPTSMAAASKTACVSSSKSFRLSGKKPGPISSSAYAWAYTSLRRAVSTSKAAGRRCSTC